jgi:hypothetical protein
MPSASAAASAVNLSLGIIFCPFRSLAPAIRWINDRVADDVLEQRHPIDHGAHSY